MSADDRTSFVTDRLRGERLDEADFTALLRIRQDPTVMASLGGVRTAAETARYLATNLSHWQRHGFGLWIVRDRASGEHVGHCGLRQVDLAGIDEVEITYAIRPKAWGRGIATEVSTALLGIAHEDLGIPEVVGFALATNTASRRVLEKIGFAYERAFRRGGQPHVLYRHT